MKRPQERLNCEEGGVKGHNCVLAAQPTLTRPIGFPDGILTRAFAAKAR